MNKFALAAASILAIPLSAQVRVETFDGPALPTGWTAQRGAWAIVNGRAQQSQRTWGYLTIDNVSLFNCVVEADVYWGTPGVQFGGVAARHANTNADDCVMVKVQSNSATVQGFDSLWNYERPGGNTSQTAISPVMTKTRIRLLVRGGQGWLEHDSNQDGVYDLMVRPRAYTAHGMAGLVGVAGFAMAGAAGVDNFALYDAVLMGAPNSVPKIGTTYQMEMQTQATSVTPFFCAAALGNGTKNGMFGAIPLGGGKFFPLAIDPLLSASASAAGALGLAGVTDANGLAKPTFPLPNLPATVGVGIHVAGLTISGSGIGNISNDHRFVIEQ